VNWKRRLLLGGGSLLLTLPTCQGRKSGVGSPSVGADLKEIAPFQYVNVAQEAGIRFRHDDCRKGMATMMEQAGPGCALLDYDGDGWPDLYLLNGRDLYGRGWPRGRRDILPHLAADHFYRLIEGKTTLQPQPILPAARKP
jgi:hypothetical protein